MAVWEKTIKVNTYEDTSKDMKQASLESFALPVDTGYDTMLYRIENLYLDTLREIDKGENLHELLDERGRPFSATVELSMSDIADMLSDSGNEEVLSRFVHTAIDEYACYRDKSISIDDANSFFLHYGYALDLAGNGMVAKELETKTPEGFAKELLKECNHADMERLAKAILENL
jgi:hypothetical protein